MKLGRFREAERKCTEVLVDIEVLNVKALFRRGQCNLELGNLTQARTDLFRAQELDTTITNEVAREIARLDALQAIVDEQEKPEAQKVVQGYLAEGDERSLLPPPVEKPPAVDPNQTLPGLLEAQKEAAERDGVDEDTYRRQREAIYNGMLRHSLQEKAA